MSNSTEKQTVSKIEAVNLRKEFLSLQLDLLSVNRNFLNQTYLQKELNRSRSAISMALDNHPRLLLLRERIYKHFVYLRKRFILERFQDTSGKKSIQAQKINA